jgi:hypothetical protein
LRIESRWIRNRLWIASIKPDSWWFFFFFMINQCDLYRRRPLPDGKRSLSLLPLIQFPQNRWNRSEFRETWLPGFGTKCCADPRSGSDNCRMNGSAHTVTSVPKNLRGKVMN